MLTCIYDRVGLQTELAAANPKIGTTPGYFDHPGYSHAGVSRVLAAASEISRTDNTVWIVVRRTHREIVAKEYRRSTEEMTRGHRHTASHWQKYSAVAQRDYIVASADMNTGKITEHSVHSSRTQAISAARDGAGIPKRQRGGRDPFPNLVSD